MSYRGVLREHASSIKAAFHLSDWIVIAGTGWLAHWIYLGAFSLSWLYVLAIVAALVVSAWLFPRFSLYQPWRGISFVEEVRSLSLAWASALLVLTALTFLSKTSIEYSRGWFGIWALLGWISLIVARVLVRGGLAWLRRRGLNQRHIVIVGSADLGEQVARRLRSAPWMGLNVIGYFDGGDGNRNEGLSGVTHLGGLDEVADYVRGQFVDQVWIVMALRDEEKVEKLLHELQDTTVDIRFVPDFFGMRLLNHSMMDVGGLPVMNLSVTPMSGLNALVKAVEDRVLSLLILLFISPLMLLIAIGVKMSSPGPIFFRQERLSWNGRPFNMLKFRSMPVDVEKGGVQWGNVKSKQTTKFGAFLRRTSLDELPQFINVLKGDMSIVGPRPERPVFVEQFKGEIPGYMKKHMVKAGITGWAQINGWRGDTDLEKRIECDLYYIENWSLWFDLKIILLTVFRGFVHKNAY